MLNGYEKKKFMECPLELAGIGDKINSWWVWKGTFITAEMYWKMGWRPHGLDCPPFDHFPQDFRIVSEWKEGFGELSTMVIIKMNFRV